MSKFKAMARPCDPFVVGDRPDTDPTGGDSARSSSPPKPWSARPALGGTSETRARRLTQGALVALALVGLGSGCDSKKKTGDYANGSVSLSLRSPESFTAPFCVALQVGAAGVAPMRAEQSYPAGTVVIETVMPNLPVGTDREVELGIFRDGSCDPDFKGADWYGSASGVEIRQGDVTIVQLVLRAGGSEELTGSVVVRAESVEIRRLHAEVVDPISTPVAGASCQVFAGADPLGTVVSGSDAATLGVIDADIQAPPGTPSLRLECRHPVYAAASKDALWVASGLGATQGTFVATVIMRRRVEILTSTPERLTFRLTLPPLKLATVATDAGTFERIVEQDQGFGTRQDAPSLPEVPTYTAMVAAPLEGSATVTVLPEGEGSASQARLYPIQPQHRDPGGEGAPTAEPVRFVFDAQAYDASATSIKDVRQRAVQQSEDGSFVAIELPAAEYLASEQRLVQYSSLLVDVTFKGAPCFKRVRTASGFDMDAIDQRIERAPSSLASTALNRALWEVSTCPILVRPIFFGARFVIVTAPALVAAANDLAAHKIARGLSTVVVTTTTTGATAAGIRSYLQNAYSNWWIRPRYLLLMGDAELIPTHYPGANNSWDGVKNGGDQHYGQFGGGSTSVPLLGIGRFPVDTNAQAQVIVDKVKAFENAPPSVFNAFYDNYSFAAQFQDNDVNGFEDRTFARTAEVIRAHVAGLGWNVQRIYRDAPTTNPTTFYDGVAVPWYLRKPTFPWTGTTADVTAAFNDGRALFFHRDHGWWDGWGTPSFGTGTLAAVAVAGHEYPFVLSINCASGIFDNEASETSGSGYSNAGSVYWAESFLRKADGALAVIGDQRSSGSSINSDLAKGLVDAIFPNLLAYGAATSVRRLGDVLNAGKGYLTSLGYGAADLEQEMTIYNLLGDPTVLFRTRGPLPVIVVGPAIVSGALRATIPPPKYPPGPNPCLTCPPLDLSQIAVVVQDAKGNVVARGFAAADGSVSLPLGEVDPRGMVVTASGPQVLPATVAVEISAPSPI
ncbi:MAG: hypothetical protein IPL40_04185 [Proteobacteria bacterium]|nr:hypothetical protein [Pseudomonadota bacterium]